MATNARIAVYNICWSSECFDSDILAALDQAVADGVDVISLSFGANGYSPPYYKDSIAIGAFGAAQHGVLVSYSAGNSGPGPFTAVNIAPWILTVGASIIDREFPANVVLGDGRVFKGVSLYSSDFLHTNGFMELIHADDCGSKYCYEGKVYASKISSETGADSLDDHLHISQSILKDSQVDQKIDDKLDSAFGASHGLKKTVPPPGSGQEIYEYDLLLHDHRGHLDYRGNYWRQKKLLKGEGENDNLIKTCWTISNITAGNKEQIQGVIEAGLIVPLVNFFQIAEFEIKKEAAWAISSVRVFNLHVFDCLEELNPGSL